MASKPAEEGEPIESAGPAPKGLGRKKLLMIGGGAVALLAAVAGGLCFSGLLDGMLGSAPAQQAAAGNHAAPSATEPVFYVLPEMLVTLNTGERRSALLKLKVTLELPNPADQAKIEHELPRIVDYCQVYLRELRPDELRGSAGSLRLREELLRRITAAVAPVQVSDLLFNDIFVQ